MATKTKERLQSTDVVKAMGMETDQAKGVVQILSRVLADIQVLYVKTLNYHWNIVGPAFYSIHELLEEQYNALKQAGDQVAERIRMYGQPVIGSMKAFQAHATLQEKTEVQLLEIDSIQELADDHEAVVAALRQDITTCSEEYEDEGAADLLTALLQEHQKMAWMLRSIARS
ncbi:DNA starvation/stationary phase protection protein [Litorilinea aerophila]|uniref:DNA starvation/stationary phase protection protein n=1 Tax=Litorilinea aerophila TaxID=1204385 RepID=A0A540V9D9_9CHLR|nr:DNA starvation/stationary phase protection protein [Litorilinea aerophila]MCC9078756.1 DNA starvation/stationary phase protection protein [Litorilinea aerophila]GIV78784.1 MAG: DNA starvation/stationary phase protection protein [Litorilinea sp.]